MKSYIAFIFAGLFLAFAVGCASNSGAEHRITKNVDSKTQSSSALPVDDGEPPDYSPSFDSYSPEGKKPEMFQNLSALDVFTDFIGAIGKSRQEVVDRYGIPTKIRTGWGLRYSYLGWSHEGDTDDNRYMGGPLREGPNLDFTDNRVSKVGIYGRDSHILLSEVLQYFNIDAEAAKKIILVDVSGQKGLANLRDKGVGTMMSPLIAIIEVPDSKDKSKKIKIVVRGKTQESIYQMEEKFDVEANGRTKTYSVDKAFDSIEYAIKVDVESIEYAPGEKIETDTWLNKYTTLEEALHKA